MADRTVLAAELSKAMVRGNFNPGHDPDRVLADVTMVLADGGEAIADIDVLRHQARGSARWRRRPQFGGR